MEMGASFQSLHCYSADSRFDSGVNPLGHFDIFRYISRKLGGNVKSNRVKLSQSY